MREEDSVVDPRGRSSVISFAPSEDEIIARSVFQGLARDILRPAARRIDQTSVIPNEILTTLWQAGLVQSVLEHSPGDRRSRVLSCILLEELGWGDASLAVAIGASMAYAQALMDHGSLAQKSNMRASFESAEFRSASVLLQEPGFGFDVEALQTHVVDDGFSYCLTGAKSFLPLAQKCDDMLVIAALHGRLDAFIVPAQMSGVEIRSAKGTLGLKGLQFAEVHFDVNLPRSSRLGEAAGSDIQSLINSSRTGIGAILTGLSRGVFEHILPYTKARVAHGSALAKKQSVAFRLADMFTDVPSMRWMCWKSADALVKGCGADRAARLAQIHCADRSVQIADEGVQLMGGHGYIRDNPVERWYRDARTLSLIEGIVGV